MDNRALATNIYEALKKEGAGIGNVSILIIKKVLDESPDAAPQPDKEAIKAAAIDHVKTVGGNDACYDSFIAGYEYAASQGKDREEKPVGDIHSAVRLYLQLPTHRQLEIWQQVGYGKPYNYGRNMGENNTAFFEWVKSFAVERFVQVMSNRIEGVQVSDTTGDDSSNAADQIKYDKLYEDFQTLCRTNEIFREENKRYKDYAGELQEKLKEKEVEIVKLKKELDGWVRYKQNIDEALNSGDGTYRP